MSTPKWSQGLKELSGDKYSFPGIEYVKITPRVAKDEYALCVAKPRPLRGTDKAETIDGALEIWRNLKYGSWIDIKNDKTKLKYYANQLKLILKHGENKNEFINKYKYGNIQRTHAAMKQSMGVAYDLVIKKVKLWKLETDKLFFDEDENEGIKEMKQKIQEYQNWKLLNTQEKEKRGRPRKTEKKKKRGRPRKIKIDDDTDTDVDDDIRGKNILKTPQHPEDESHSNSNESEEDGDGGTCTD